MRDEPAPHGGYHGIYKAFVRDVADPLKLGRVRLFCPGVMGEEDVEDKWLDWAEPFLAFARVTASGDEGSVSVPDDRAPVWVMFEDGNPDFPIYVGCRATGDRPSNSCVPKSGRGEDDGTLGVQRTVEGVVVPAATGPLSSSYAHNSVVRTLQGVVMELDDNPTNERLRVRHPAGSWEEWQPNGAIWKQVVADFLLWVGNNLKVGVVQQVVVGCASILLGSTSASERIVKESAMLAKYNNHAHAITALPVAGGGGGTVTGVTGKPDLVLSSPADFGTKVRFE